MKIRKATEIKNEDEQKRTKELKVNRNKSKNEIKWTENQKNKK